MPSHRAIAYRNSIVWICFDQDQMFPARKIVSRCGISARDARPGPAHCSLMSAALITLPQRPTSSCMYLAVFSTEPPKTSADNFFKWSRMSG